MNMTNRCLKESLPKAAGNLSMFHSMNSTTCAAILFNLEAKRDKISCASSWAIKQRKTWVRRTSKPSRSTTQLFQVICQPLKKLAVAPPDAWLLRSFDHTKINKIDFEYPNTIIQLFRRSSDTRNEPFMYEQMNCNLRILINEKVSRNMYVGIRNI